MRSISMQTAASETAAGYSYLELLLVVAVIGVISSVGFAFYSDSSKSAQKTALEAQTRTLNAAVKAYVNAGGSLTGLSSVEEVITQLKTLAVNGEAIAGFRGNFVDPRLQAVSQTGEEASTQGEWRVRWDAEAQRFVLASDGQKGIKSFALNEAAAPAQPAEEVRQTTWKLATKGDATGAKWVWDYDDTNTERNLPAVPGADVDPEAAIGGAMSYSSISQLRPPVYSLPSGTYPLPDFPQLVGLTDVNADGSQLYYSLNGSDWTLYVNPVSVPPGAQLAAFAATTDITQYYSSFTTVEAYDSNTIQLTVPDISTSAAQFHPVQSAMVTLTLSHGNDPIHGKAVYSLDGGPWTDYAEPVALNIDHFVSGVVIDAKCVAAAWPDYYLESEAVESVLPAVTITLDPPNIATSDTQFIYPDIREAITVDITNSNVVGFSKTLFSLDGGETWEDFTEQATVEASEFHGGVTILARTEPIVHQANILASEPVSQPIDVWVRPQLEAPAVTEPELADRIFMAPQGSYPDGVQIYYTLDGTDPGDNRGFPVNGTLYTGDFPLESLLCADFDLAARVYGPAGSEEYYIPSPVTTFVKTSKQSRQPHFELVCGFATAGFCDYGWLTLGDSKIIGNSATVQGLGVGPSHRFDAGHPLASPTEADPSSELINVVNPVWKDMSPLQLEAIRLNLLAESMTPTQTFNRINKSTTITSTAPGGWNVIAINEITLSATPDTLTLSGSADDFFIVNISSKLKLVGGATLKLDGVNPRRVLFNVSAGASVELSGTSLVVDGTLLAPGCAVEMAGTTNLNGTVISGPNSSIAGDAAITHLSSFGCE